MRWPDCPSPLFVVVGKPNLQSQNECGQLSLESEHDLSSARFVRLFSILFLCLAVVACRTPSSTISFPASKSVTPFRAVIEDVHRNSVRASDGNDYLAIAILLRRDDGTLVNIVIDRATLTQAAFAQGLVKGRAYEWPKAFTDFKQKTQQTQRTNYRNSSWASPSTTN